MERRFQQNFGIPKTRIQSRGGRIVTDVLVGEDSIARAIRFVYGMCLRVSLILAH